MANRSSIRILFFICVLGAACCDSSMVVGTRGRLPADASAEDVFSVLDVPTGTPDAPSVRTDVAIAQPDAAHDSLDAHIDVDTSVVNFPSGLVAYYPLDGIKGSAIPDLSGQGNHGTVADDVTNMPTDLLTSIAGKFGGSLDLGKARSHVRLPAGGSLSTIASNNQFTISAWVKLNSKPTFDAGVFTIVERCMFNVGDRGQLIVYALPPSKPTAYGILPLGTWVHIALTYDGIATTVSMGGVYGPRVDMDLSLPGAKHELYLGGNLGGSSIENMSLQLDEVLIFNRALSQREIEDLARATQAAAIP